jgi:quaternary ammonium compound-resistance protein SugE
MPWLILVLAGLLETVWAVGLKFTDGFTRPAPTALTVTALIASVWLLALAMRSLPLGTAYAVWTGIGTIGTVIVGILRFGESASLFRLACIGLIVAGLVGLKFAPGSR